MGQYPPEALLSDAEDVAEPTMGPVFFVYMVRCADGTLYTGFARDPEKRVVAHNKGKGAKYTRSRLPVVLTYVEECASLSAALKREHELKPWSRSRKEDLITEARRERARAARQADQ